MFKGFSFSHKLQQLKKQSDVNNGENGGHQYSERGIQQDDNYKEFMGWITDGGLRYAYAMHHGTSENLYRKKVDKEHERHVIIVGAGMAGLSAAYELAQIGHKVTILEVQSRVGGRVKTIREGFTEGLHSEAGAMRLPPNHYLTWHYLNLFGVETVPFQNYNENGYLCLYGEKIRMHDWKNNNKKYSNKFWPGWDDNLTEADKEKYSIDGILSYYDATMKPIKAELGPSPSEKKWHDWLHKWSKLSTEDFLRGYCADEMKCSPLSPWTEQAIEGYKVSTYTPTLGTDIATHLREDLGKWWQDPLKTPKLGMDTLPKAFTKKNENGWNLSVDLLKRIKFGIMVTKVENVEHVKDKKAKMVKVTGENMSTGHKETFEGDAVILTLPLPILRQLDIPFSIEKQKAISQISYAASTKIMLQCKKRFWQKDVGHGGFSKTDMMIGQLHYPDYNEQIVTVDNNPALIRRPPPFLVFVKCKKSV
ncbi:putative L-amino-acid oxidase YobN [Mercenaria mercenaria]|uniref:putative L-amino-acid oxidase YobN n=1 Tax=Mercenaria mercenaria TaxID=6596 RepID=UPI00234F52F5|nr:putative L-amino-acid oxidase YobN [Mercenaria mercenaria]